MLFSTERCFTKYLEDSDAAEAVALFTDKQVREYLGGVISEDDAYIKLHYWKNNNEDQYFCIRLNASNEFVGIISISPHHDNTKKELSYQFLPHHWGKGIATETLTAVLQYCKETLGLIEIVSETQSKNARSCRLLENLGFKLESTVFRFGAEQIIYKLKL